MTSIEKITLLNCFNLDPDDFRLQTLLAIFLRQEKKYAESLGIFKKLIKERGDCAELYFQVAEIFYTKRCVFSAEKNYEKSISLDPGKSEYFFALSFCRFLNFEFEKAWLDHEKRLFMLYGDLGGPAGGRYLTDCRWYTGAPDNARVLVWADEGVGDEIKYGSMLPELRGRVGRLHVQIDRRLIPLFRRSMPSDVNFYAREETIPGQAYDCHVAIGSLGRYLRPDQMSFVHRGSKYLVADPKRVRHMRKILELKPGEGVVGISWRSNNPVTGEARTLALRDLIQRLCAPNVRIVSLQYGEVDAEIKAAGQELGITVWQCPGLDTTEDLDGVAALIEACDEVISIGNTTAHLAGALGKKTTVILRQAPNWRWLEKRGQSLWYQSARVIPWSDGF